VRAHGEKRYQLAIMEEWRVDHDIVQMLAAHIGMIHEQHVPGAKSVFAMHAHAVDDSGAEIGEKNWQRAEVLRENISFRIDNTDAVVAHFVDHHVVRCFTQHRRHFIGDMGQAVANNFDRDRINGG